MPLSEDEQRILRQIEEHLQRDTGFKETLHKRRHGSRRVLGLSGCGAAVFVLLAVVGLSVHPVVAFAAFVVALVLALVAERQLRAIGSESLSQLQDSVRERFGAPGRPNTSRPADQ